jgi:hypothetical protein
MRDFAKEVKTRIQKGEIPEIEGFRSDDKYMGHQNFAIAHGFDSFQYPTNFRNVLGNNGGSFEIIE